MTHSWPIRKCQAVVVVVGRSGGAGKGAGSSEKIFLFDWIASGWVIGWNALPRSFDRDTERHREKRPIKGQGAAQ